MNVLLIEPEARGVRADPGIETTLDALSPGALHEGSAQPVGSLGDLRERSAEPVGSLGALRESSAQPVGSLGALPEGSAQPVGQDRGGLSMREVVANLQLVLATRRAARNASRHGDDR